MMLVKKKKYRHHSLTGRITEEVMLRSFKSVKRNRGAAGVDKVSIAMYEANLQQNLDSLMRKLKTDTFIPAPLKRKFVPKGKGKLRPLAIPTVRTRIAHEVIRSIIEPIFDKQFHTSSHGFRKGRSCHTAIKELLGYHQQGYKIVVDADIKNFFDNIPHKLIMAMITREISDGKTLNTIRKFLKAGVMEDGKLIPTRKGACQGGVISPLISNIVLNHLDWTLNEMGYKFVRYADDFVILTKSRPTAEKALEIVKRCLENDLELELSPEKTEITDFNRGFEFLGYFISSRSVKMRDKAVEKFKEKIRKITVRKHNLEQRTIKSLNSVIKGTVNYFNTEFTSSRKQFLILDKWIRKRIRCMKYKRLWRTDNCKLKNKHIKRMGLLFCHDLCLARKG